MSIDDRTFNAVNKLGQHKKNSTSKKLKLPQRVTIIVLLLFSTNFLESFPFNIGPLSQTMIFEIIAFAVIFPRLKFYIGILDRRDKNLFFIGTCMFILGLVNLSGSQGIDQVKTIFTSLYAYFFVVCFFSGRPEYGVWLRRLHLIPVLTLIWSFGADAISNTRLIFFESQIRNNFAANYLVILFPFCWAQYQRERGLFRLLNLFALGATPLVIVLTGSRTALIVFLVITMFMFYVEKPSKRIVIMASILLLGLTLFIVIPENSSIIRRISTLKNPFAELQIDRVGLWKAAILSIKENPLTGGNFRANVFRLVLEAAPESKYARHIISGSTKLRAGVHNGYLAVMVDYGLIVAFLFFRFFFLLLKALSKTRQIILSEANRSLLSAGLITTIGFAITSISTHFYMNLSFFIIWAVLQSSIKNSLVDESLEVV
jgi:hypothetical protein